MELEGIVLLWYDRVMTEYGIRALVAFVWFGVEASLGEFGGGRPPLSTQLGDNQSPPLLPIILFGGANNNIHFSASSPLMAGSGIIFLRL